MVSMSPLRLDWWIRTLAHRGQFIIFAAPATR